MPKVYVALENIRSLYNIGAIFRTCSFFGVEGIILVGYSGKITLPNGTVVLHEEILKSSLGSEQDLDIVLLESSTNLMEYAHDRKIELVSVEQAPGSIMPKQLKKEIGNITEKNIIVVFGNEISGVSKDILESSCYILEIPRKGKHNSLNVTTACGIILYELSTKN